MSSFGVVKQGRTLHSGRKHWYTDPFVLSVELLWKNRLNSSFDHSSWLTGLIPTSYKWETNTSRLTYEDMHSKWICFWPPNFQTLLFCVVILSLVIHDFVWGNRTLLPKYCFQVAVCLHRFLGNEQCIIIMIVWNMFCCKLHSLSCNKPLRTCFK
jgi:hypothetical protein